MIITCHNCTSRFQIEDDIVSSNVKCPKCDSSVNVIPSSPAFEKGALGVGGSPATETRRFEHSNPAPLFKLHSQAADNKGESESEKLMQLFASLLGNPEVAARLAGDSHHSKQRKALVCAPADYREKLAQQLAEDDCQVFVAFDAKQAVERMRGNQLDIVLLDPQFDATEQGAAFVVREVNVMRPAQRRRLFFVLLSPSLRTMDAHGAFLNNVNAIVNLKDLEDLVKILDHAIREYNQLYKEFNVALNVASI